MMDGLSIDQRIHRDIAEAIYDQRMPPGTRLSEAGLGALYKVSRTVVRKALFRLAGDKLIDLRPNRGAVVWQPSVAEAHDVFEARRLLECALLATGIARLTDDDVATLESLVSADIAAHESSDRQLVIRSSAAFHQGLADCARNQALSSALAELIGRTSLIIALYERRESAACSPSAHKDLLGAVITRDVDRAQKIMAAHLQQCEARLALEPSTAGDSLAAMLGTTPYRDAL